MDNQKKEILDFIQLKNKEVRKKIERQIHGQMQVNKQKVQKQNTKGKRMEKKKMPPAANTFNLSEGTFLTRKFEKNIKMAEKDINELER
jgi:hypothetical protein